MSQNAWENLKEEFYVTRARWRIVNNFYNLSKIDKQQVFLDLMSLPDVDKDFVFLTESALMDRGYAIVKRRKRNVR